jgi:hypothetical protein
MDTYHINRFEQVFRPLEHMAAVGWLYPEAWRQIDKFRASKGKNSLPDWPDWCFLPMAAFYAIVSKEAGVTRLPPHLLPDVTRLAAIGTWRYTRGIYRFYPDVSDAVMSAKISSGLSSEVFFRLPEWCVYIEMPEREWGGMSLHGFFAHMEWDTEEGRATLRLLLDCEEGLYPYPVRLDADALDVAVSRATKAARMQSMGGGRFSGTSPGNASASMADSLEPLVSLVLYLCGEDADISEQGGKALNSPILEANNENEWLEANFGYPQETVRRWQVGKRMGLISYTAHDPQPDGK